MHHTSFIMYYGGKWEDDNYIGGDKRFVLVPETGLTYSGLIKEIHWRVGINQGIFAYMITTLVESIEGESLKMDIRNDNDLKFVMDMSKVPKFYVTISPVQTETSPQKAYPPNMHQNFVSLLNEQIAHKGNTSSLPKAIPSSSALAIVDHTHEASNENFQEFGAGDEDMCTNIDDDGDLRFQNDEEDDEDFLDNGSDEDSEETLEEESDEDNMDNETLHSSGMSTSCHSNTTTSGSARSSQWMIPGASYQASLPFNDTAPREKYSRDALCKGAIFPDKNSLQIALGLYHLTNRVEYSVERSASDRYSVLCKYKNDNCKFCMRATSKYKSSIWRVTYWVAPHTCQPDAIYQADRRVSSKVIGAYFAPHLLNDGAELKPKEMASLLRREFGLHIQYCLARAGRNRALKMVYGATDESFKRMPAYLHVLQKTNPGSVIDVKTDSSGTFEYSFMAFHASIHSFLSSGRPVIIVDGTHLKGRYKGILFIAVTNDGNEQVFPLAFGLGDVENDRAWIWFLKQLKRAFGCPKNLLIISDQHRSISNAVNDVYPSVPHSLCTFHLQKNLGKSNLDVVLMFKNAARSYTETDFESKMDLLKSEKGVFDRLMQLGPERWARSKCPVQRYDFMTSNSVECMNNCLKWARRLPVCKLLETIGTRLGRWFYERREKAIARDRDLTEYASKKLEESIEEGLTMDVEPINAFRFNVKCNDKGYLVDLNEKSCSCKEFDLDEIPCAHAAAAIRKAKQKYVSYVSRYFQMDTLREMYSKDINLVPNEEEWHVPDDIISREIKVPKNPKQAGRPQKKRIRSGWELSSRKRARVCSKCSKKGHYRATCTEKGTALLTDNEDVQVAAIRRSKRCSICHVAGHNCRKCPLRHNANKFSIRCRTNNEMQVEYAPKRGLLNQSCDDMESDDDNQK